MAILRTRRRWLVAAVVVALLAGLIGWLAWPAPPGHTTEEFVLPGAGGVELEATLYLPAGASAADPAPAVLLAHGFGGSMHSVAGDAADLAAAGYAVLAWSARGFGNSGGEIHLNHPDHEVRDAQLLLDWLARRPEVRQDGPGNPRVGVVGSSYGGALALLLAAHDDRVDAIVPSITWYDLARAFLPEATGQDPAGGVFKQAWASLFFGSTMPGGDPACGRFAADVCQLYQRVATSGRGDADVVARLRESSPAGVLDRITAPTLLIQGTADSLFPLSEADANAAGIAATGTPVRVAWFTGGHDGGPGPQSDEDRLHRLTVDWLDHHLAGTGDNPGGGFSWSRISGFSTMNRGLSTAGYRAEEYPGLTGTEQVAVGLLEGPAQSIAHPPGGQPAAVSSLPAAGGGLASFVDGVVTDLPGQSARTVSVPLHEPLDVVGASTVRIRAASPTGEAVLFVKLYDLAPNGIATLPAGLVAPVRLTGLPDAIEDAEPVTVTLPAIARRVEAGNRLAVTIATTDQAYHTGNEPVTYQVAVDGPVNVPTVAGEPLATPETVWWWLLAALLAAVAAGVALAVLVARWRWRRAADVDPARTDIPLHVQGLRKEYGDGFAAVAAIDLTVQRGQVVGLLGPNGAGKTTALRVVLGLTRPTAGQVRVFGHRLVPGAPVLSRVGALVEGPGLLPHMSGRANLAAYWRATGRPLVDARMDEVIAIAGLGESIDRKVRTYSHGMKQRLAVAQAMLGMPELLVLDEPTDGLDPPQIAEMRRVLAGYAGDDRAVLLSSHLLAEVEQTCTHVVVVHKGVVVAAGPTSEVVGDSPTVTIDVSDMAAAQRVVGQLPGVRPVASEGERGLVVDLDGRPRSEVVAALVHAGVDVDRVVPRRRLEDAFLALVGAQTKGSGDR